MLRTRRERPSRGSATDQYNEFPSPHGFAHAEDQFGYQENITFWIRNCALRYAKPADLMSALGQKQTLVHVRVMSALPPKADMDRQSCDVCFVPKADIRILFEQLIGALLEKWRYVETERFGSL